MIQIFLAPIGAVSAPDRRRLKILIFVGPKKSWNFNVTRVYINDEVNIDTYLTIASTYSFLANLFFDFLMTDFLARKFFFKSAPDQRRTGAGRRRKFRVYFGTLS